MFNVDKKEINKFDTLANEWWNPNGKLRTLHQINPLRTQFIEKCVGDLENSHIADIGCGGGILAERLAKKKALVTGLDLSEQSISIAKLHLLKSKLPIVYLKNSVELFSTHNAKKFDIVTCMEMLEHVPNPKIVIQSCAQLCKTNGWLFFSTLNRNIKSFISSILIAEYIIGLIPKGTHEYKKYIKPSELVDAATESNLQIKKILGIHYNPFTRKFSLGKGIDINYITAFKKISE